ncbi:MAG TPA: response regulator transcription factor [Pseudolysinimonas sp.]|nr:response regulator transcription factor [Pseudolysinimonas sp.]
MKRVALVDDHEVVSIAVRSAVEQLDDLEFVGSAATVPDLLAQFADVDIAILDLRLADGSSPVTNVTRLDAAGARTLVFTSGESPYLMRSVAKTHVYGIVRKSAPMTVLVEALRRVAAGEAEMSAEWAAVIDTDPQLPSAALSPQEQQVLELLARGLKSQSVAYELGIATTTVDDYVRRIRAKYQRAGRPAHTRIDLYRRAVEDGILPPPAG